MGKEREYLVRYSKRCRKVSGYVWLCIYLYLEVCLLGDWRVGKVKGNGNFFLYMVFIMCLGEEDGKVKVLEIF